MNVKDIENQARIGRQAMNIQVMELKYQSIDSDGKPIDDSIYSVMVIYNRETISENEVKELIQNGSYENDPRIIVANPQQIANLFPHRGETKRTGGYAYWRSFADKNDFIHCECSSCGFITKAIDAVKIGTSSADYVDVNYRFCPKCGAIMEYKPKGE